jgi:hypothetical protein
MKEYQIKKELNRNIREKLDELSDENIKWIMNSLYLGVSVDGPYMNGKGKWGTQDVCEDHKQREFHKQIFLGNYGPAGIVYTVNGSPPRGTIIVSEQFVVFDHVFVGKQPITIHKYDIGIKYKLQHIIARYFLKAFELEKSSWMENKTLS